MPLGVEVGLGPGDYVLDGDPAPASLKTGGSTPDQFSAYVDCGQTAGWIKTALGTEVGLGPGHIVLGGDPAPLPKKGDGPLLSTFPLHFSSNVLMAKRLDGSRRHLARRCALVQTTL